MTEQRAVTKTNSQTLTAFGARDDVRELRERLKLMIPGGNKLNDNELTALAQGAIAHSLDPLNGEIWIIPNRGLMIGVKGLRKKAREQVKGNFWIDFREIENIEERRRFRIPDGALAFEARLFDSENVRTYTETVERMLKAGIPWEAVERMVGSKPYTSGIGVLLAGENTKMQPVQCAMKRAEADAIKRRFDVPFGMAIDTESDDAEFGGDWIDGNAEVKTRTSDERKPDREALFGDDEPETPQEAPQPTPQPEPTETPVSTPSGAKQAASSGDKPAGNWRAVKVKTPLWKSYQWKVSEAYPQYADSVGTPVSEHILGALAAEGWTEINHDNINDILPAIEKHVAQKQAA